MEHLSDISTGLLAIAFWGFIGMCVLGGIWDTIKKRETKHETLRRLVESGQPLDENLLKHLDMMNRDGAERFDRGFIITALWLLPVAVGLAAFAYFLGFVNREAQIVIFGVSALVAVMGLCCLLAGKAIAPWYQKEGDDGTNPSSHSAGRTNR